MRGLHSEDAWESALGSTAIRNPEGKEAEGKASGRAERVEDVRKVQMIPRNLVDNIYNRAISRRESVS